MCDSCNYSDSSSEGSDSNSEHSDSESEESQEESCSGGSCSRRGNSSGSGGNSCGRGGGGNSCGRSGNGCGRNDNSCGRSGNSCGRSGNSCGRRSGVQDIASSFLRLGKDCTDGACSRPGGASLPFDPTAIQDIILKLSDMFDLRVNMSSDQMKAAVMITSGLALAGSVIGKSFGGNMGAAIGGAVGGACGVGYTLVSLRDVWDEVWWKLSELFDITYDFLGGLGFQDYQTALQFLLTDKNKGAHLAKILAEVASSVLGKNVIPSFDATMSLKKGRY